MNRKTVAGEVSVTLLCSTFRLSRAHGMRVRACPGGQPFTARLTHSKSIFTNDHCVFTASESREVTIWTNLGPTRTHESDGARLPRSALWPAGTRLPSRGRQWQSRDRKWG